MTGTKAPTSSLHLGTLMPAARPRIKVSFGNGIGVPHFSPKVPKFVTVAMSPMTEGPMTEGPMTEGPMTEGPMTEGPMTEGQTFYHINNDRGTQ